MRGAALRRIRAWLLLATFVASIGSTGLSLDHIIDTACGEVALAPGGAGTRLASPKGSAEHCPVCHFLRAVSGASAAAPVRMAVLHGQSIEFFSITESLPAVDLTTVASRGPPARPLNVNSFAI